MIVLMIVLICYLAGFPRHGLVIFSAEIWPIFLVLLPLVQYRRLRLYLGLNYHDGELRLKKSKRGRLKRKV